MTGDILITLAAVVPTIAVFLATLAFLRVRRENDALRQEIDDLRSRARADERHFMEVGLAASAEASTAARAGEPRDQ